MENEKTEQLNVQEKKDKSFKEKYNVFLVTTFTVIILILMGFTGYIGYQALEFFVLQPASHSGSPVYGYRLEDLPEISSTVLEEATAFGQEQKGVEAATFDVRGQVIYLNVEVASDTELKVARSSAEAMATELQKKLDNKELYRLYDLQMVVYNDDPLALKEANRAEEITYVREFNNGIVEEILAHAEKYPTVDTIDRARQNILLMPDFLDKEETVANEVKDKFEARLAEIVEWTAEEVEAAGEIPEKVVNQDVPESELASYPSWGAYDSDEETYVWK